MKLKSFNQVICLLIISFYSPLLGEEKIDIWKNKNTKESIQVEEKDMQKAPNLQPSKTIKSLEKIKIEDSSAFKLDEKKVYGIYEPASYDFGLNMWSQTKAEDLRSSLNRLNKIELSKSSYEILEAILFSFSYPPPGMTDKEFTYLEKFKIYCLVFNNKKPEAQLLLDLLREQKQSSKFYDDKINFLLGVSDQTSNKINEQNLLNFYLSSVTIPNFKFEPTNKTKPEIWTYLNAANLIQLEDASDKKKLKELEIAANNNQLNKDKIFEIYKKIPFNLNTLINAKNNYQSLNESDARALIFQKYLLSDSNESRIELLFLLEELFKKSDLMNVYAKFLSDQIEELGLDNLPDDYRELALSKIVSEEELTLGKVKYNDKILHQSKILKYFVEGESKAKVQKDIDKIFKKIAKNKKYFISGKDLALADALITDGFILPSSFKFNELTEKLDVPNNLLELVKNNQKAFLALKIVEIIGEDEPHQLDSETIFFVTNLLNKMNLVTIRNKVLNSALPKRI